MDDTIAAIATPVGTGGLAVVRVSGPNALAVADRVFRSPRGRPSSFPSHTVHLGRVVAGEESVDHALLSILRGPHSYTREDTVELSCHGGSQTAARVLGSCLSNGARLAEPGEFTRRAFLNGRLDLTQAEAVLDIIQARTERAQRAALRMLEGHLAQRVRRFRNRLVDHLAFIEAHIDFPEEDLPPLAVQRLQADLGNACREAEALLATAAEGRLLREGASVAIVGRPNVGKSSLMNALLGAERSIVTPVPGTTRDTVEEAISIQGFPVCLVDTAGVRRARGLVEAHGVRRTREAIQDAELVLVLFDSSRRWTAHDRQVWTACDAKNRLLVLSKSDLPRRAKLPEDLIGAHGLFVSAVTGEGLLELRSAIERRLSGLCNILDGNIIAINSRQEADLRHALLQLTSANKDAAAGASIEIVVQGVRAAVHALDSLTGESATDDILDRIFSRFCIGK